MKGMWGLAIAFVSGVVSKEQWFVAWTWRSKDQGRARAVSMNDYMVADYFVPLRSAVLLEMVSERLVSAM